ncbi:UpxY family transcription antiterminator [Flavivirga jejuensis]|uniref:UpxY family transcription antiterminator n=1 Tax=Flavivirga jejuensis TaxID=870487 RepID=A0ABT8WKH5_9FLAO|nr:UpxY family transcription antiterminator [Flavivirga jejuensis]MDO5973613.1 UpxY family transcription antiterminator [Flavivirga jejuensis]
MCDNIDSYCKKGETVLELKPNKNWYVFYTAPRAEKIVKQELSFQDYEVFLPVKKSLKTWKNRQKKMIEEVLFPSYIFVNTEERYLSKICQIPKVVTFLHCGGKPSKVDFENIKGIKKMLNLNRNISVEPNFKEGENVRIISGPLAGYEGILAKRNTKTRFGILLKEINQIVFVDINSSNIESYSQIF